MDPAPTSDKTADESAETAAAGTRAAKSKAARRRSPLWTKLVIVLGALILAASLGAITVVQVGLHEIGSRVRQQSLLGDDPAPNAGASGGAANGTFNGTNIAGPINILLVGVDTRPDPNTESHSDTIIIAHIPATHDRVYLVSIPRDTSATIPADPAANFPGGTHKINAAFTFGSRNGQGDAGGFGLLTKTIKQAWNITFNGGAIVNFDGFKDIVTKLGGVTMYVDETTHSIHHGIDTRTGRTAAPYRIDVNSGVPICPRGKSFDVDPDACTLPFIKEVVYAKGVHHLSAYQALDFVRCRDGLVGTDYARQRHQQQFIKAVLTEAYQKGLNNPLKLSDFMTSIGQAFIFDGRGVPMRDWIFTLKGISPDSMITIKTNDGQFVAYTGPGASTESRQSLSPDSLDLLRAVREDTSTADDKVGDFLATHQSWVTNS